MSRQPGPNRHDRDFHLFVVLLAGFVYLGIHLLRLTVVDARTLRAKADAQRERVDVIHLGRGRVLDARDRVLAGNVAAVSLYGDARIIPTLADAQRAFSRIASVKDAKKGEFLRNFESGKRFYWVARNQDPARLPFIKSEGGRFRSTVRELPVVQSERRVYPKGSLAGHLLGFTGVDNQGLEGLELQFEEAMKGREGRVEMKRDGRGQVIPGSVRVVRSPRSGLDVRLNLDAFVQHSAELHLQEMVNDYHAKGANAVVVQAATGRVLAMASVPRINPAGARAVKADGRRNRLLTDVYEPGSVFKTILATAALDSGLVKPEDRFPSPGRMQVGKHIIKDSHEKSYGMVTLGTILEKSLNTGAAHVGFHIGAPVLEKYLRAYGFDSPTGLELAYESPGLWPYTEKGGWKKIQVATLSYGHGIGVTPLQVARAYAAIANGGVLMPLSLVKQVGPWSPFSPKAKAKNLPKPQAPRRVMSEKTAALLRKYLMAAAEEGTGKSAMLVSHHVGGKTGTTRKVRAGGRGYESRYIGSFAGFFPATRPEYVIVVTVDEPSGSGYGGVVAAPVFRKIAEDMAFYFKIAPDKKEASLALQKVKR